MTNIMRFGIVLEILKKYYTSLELWSLAFATSSIIHKTFYLSSDVKILKPKIYAIS